MKTKIAQEPAYPRPYWSILGGYFKNPLSPSHTAKRSGQRAVALGSVEANVGPS